MGDTPDQSPAADVTADATQHRVEAWLRNNGVDLEMRVAGAFRAALSAASPVRLSWAVDHGRTYVSRHAGGDEANMREIDVVVRATTRTLSDAWISLWLVAECKSSKSDPWVLYRSSDRRDLPAQTITDAGWQVRSAEGLDPANILGWSAFELMSANVTPCYAASSTNSKSGGNAKNYARDAALQALSAVRGVAADVPVRDHQRTAAVLVPVVVTAAPMFAVTLSDEGGYRVEPTVRELLAGRFEAEDDEPRKLWVVHESEVNDLAQQFAAAALQLEYRT